MMKWLIGKKLKVDIDTTIAHCGTEVIGLTGSHENLKTLCDLLHLLTIKQAREQAKHVAPHFGG